MLSKDISKDLKKRLRLNVISIISITFGSIHGEVYSVGAFYGGVSF